jgi:putative radical SAM enzyme (TIGR03279 family)
MPAPRVLAVAPGSPAARAGVQVGDEVEAVDGERPRDIIRWTWLTDEADPTLDLRRGGLELSVEVRKEAGEPLGIDVHSALFDQLRTCDNHCEFCFIYQLPPGLRSSLYQKDDDYRLSFLYGNFTTLTRFTEADLERVVTEGLSPLNVSIHAVAPEARNDLLRNRRGGPSLRWLRALLDHGVEVHGQIVCCPGLNDGAVLDDTLAGVLERFPELASICVVPLGISRYNTEPRMRPTTPVEAAATIDCVEDWQDVFSQVLGRRLVHAADEYYLLAGRPFPAAEAYEGFSMHEDGVGMARTFELEFHGQAAEATTTAPGFFAWADRTSAPAGSRYEAAADLGAPPEGYRAERAPAGTTAVALRPRRGAPVAILTGEAAAPVLAPLIDAHPRDDVRVLPVENRFFGGTTSVTGLLVGEDLARVLADEPATHRYLLPDVCLSGGRFLDGTTPDDLPRAVEIIPTDGAALRRALEA